MTKIERWPSGRLIAQASHDGQDIARCQRGYERWTPTAIAKDQAAGNDIVHPEDVEIYVHNFVHVFKSTKRLDT